MMVETLFYCDLVYKFKRIVRKPDFSDQFKNKKLSNVIKKLNLT